MSEISTCTGGSFEIGDGVLCQPVDDELVLLNMTDQQYYGLDGVGARMWQLLLEYADIDRVVELICAEYDVDETIVRSDISSLVERLGSAGLLRPATGAHF